MFLKRIKAKEGKTRTYWALVKSVRTAREPRHQVVSYLGELQAGEKSEWANLTRIVNKRPIPGMPLFDTPETAAVRRVAKRKRRCMCDSRSGSRRVCRVFSAGWARRRRNPSGSRVQNAEIGIESAPHPAPQGRSGAGPHSVLVPGLRHVEDARVVDVSLRSGQRAASADRRVRAD